VSLRDYDVVWLRLPPPLSLTFLEFLSGSFPNQFFINDPIGIYETGSKAFLLNFEQYCPPMKRCQSIEDIIEFKRQFPIVLKPLREYGGKGIVRIDGDVVWQGNEQIAFQAFTEQQKGSAMDYMGVKFLKNVSEGDKRIVVVNGQILGASLRLPADGSWLCNVAMGGSSNPAEVTSEERAIISGIHPHLAKLGVIMYGVDTLVDDEGRRVLSEINTTSIGGVAQIAQQNGEPVIEKAVALIWDYIIKTKSTKDVISH
jgi:glutathione synthase